MAPKAPEKSPQSHQQLQAAHPITNAVAVVKTHSSPFYISAHYLCHNKRLKQKRSRYAEYIRNASSQRRSIAAISKACNKKTDERRQILSHLTAEVTIDLLSDDDEDDVDKKQYTTNPSGFRGRMCLERAAVLGLMPVECLQNGPPPLVPFVNKSRPKKKVQSTPQLLIQQKLKQQQQRLNSQQHPRKRKSHPQKRKSLPPPFLLNHESIVLSDDSDVEQNAVKPHIPYISPSITIAPDLTVVYPSNQQIPCHMTTQNTMQVDEEVTISLVPRSLTATTCNKREVNVDQTISQEQAFSILPDETTVHTVIANRIYELSLTKLREGLASCGIPEFNGGGGVGQQKKITPTRRKGAVQPPPGMISPPQAPISLKLSSDLSISLISDDDEDDAAKHHRSNETLLSPAFLQKLPVNVSIAPVTLATQHASTMAIDPRNLKFG